MGVVLQHVGVEIVMAGGVTTSTVWMCVVLQRVGVEIVKAVGWGEGSTVLVGMETMTVGE